MTRRTIWRKLGARPIASRARRGRQLLDDGDTGPCGRCSEIYYVPAQRHDPEIELWNNVFMEFERSKDGTLLRFRRSHRHGPWLERITAVMQGKQIKNYDTDSVTPAAQPHRRDARPECTRRQTHDISMRVIADHIRIDDVSSRWRHPLDECADTCFAKDHAPRDAAWEASRLHQPFMHELVGPRSEMATPIRIRTGRERSRDDSPRGTSLREVLTEGLPRTKPSWPKSAGTRSSPAGRCCLSLDTSASVRLH